MDWLYGIFAIFMVLALAFLAGWSTTLKRPAAQFFVWIGAILALLSLRSSFTKTRDSILLALALVLSGLEHIPLWFVFLAIVAGASYFIALRLANSTVELAQELERTNTRMTLLENSISRKLDDIASRLPERDEPDYLKELRKEGMLD